VQIIPTSTDDQLLRHLHQSDELAFAEIFNRYWKPLYTSAHNILQVKEAAQDAVQGSFLFHYGKRRTEVQVDILQSYLHQAVRFQVFKAIRAEKQTRTFLTGWPASQKIFSLKIRYCSRSWKQYTNNSFNLCHPMKRKFSSCTAMVVLPTNRSQNKRIFQ